MFQKQIQTKPENYLNSRLNNTIPTILNSKNLSQSLHLDFQFVSENRVKSRKILTQRKLSIEWDKNSKIEIIIRKRFLNVSKVDKSKF